MEETVLNGIFSAENLKQYRRIIPIGITDIDIGVLNERHCDYVMKNWNDAETLCLELEKQYPQFMFVLYFDQNAGVVFHVFHAIARTHAHKKNRRKWQEMALTYDVSYHPDYEIDFKEQSITEL